MPHKTHSKKNMKKDAQYAIIVDKIVASHRMRCVCACPVVVKNLMGGLRVWTRVEFECGERIKINCHCLEKVQ